MLIGCQCVNFVYFAQVASIVGSGLMASSIVQTMGGASETVWFTQVLNILAVAISPPVSQMVDLWGRKWILVFLILMGFVGAIIVSQAHTTAVAIVGFTILGMNFGAQPILVAVASEVIPRKHRAWAQGLLNMSAGTGGVTGLMTGAALVQGGNAGNFRFYFYMIAAFFGVAMIGCALFYNPPPRELQITMTFAAKIRKLDWLGYALFAPGCTLFSIALCWSENPWPWSSARVTAPFVVGILMLVLLAIFEWRFAKNGSLPTPVLPERIFH